MDAPLPFDNNVAKRGQDFIVSCDLCDLRILAALVRLDSDAHEFRAKCTDCGYVTRYALTDEQYGDVLGMAGPIRVRFKRA